VTVNESARCAVYARYSNEKQNSLTIDQQVRKCREFASSQSLPVLGQHIYADEAISGATDDRAGLRRLLSAAQERPRPFDVVLVDDTSRLSRDLEHSLGIMKQLKFAGIRVLFVSQGFDTSAPQTQTLVTVHGLVDSLYLEELAKKTFRGVEQRALEGLHTGGRCFGYRNVPIEDPTQLDTRGRPVVRGVRLEVDLAEAGTVRRIFDRYSHGHSLKRIAQDLNADGILSPQPQRGRIQHSWCPSSVRTILYNERYRGHVVWGKTKKIRSPKTGKRIYERLPKSEWKVREIAEQRIVSDELWNAVCERRRLVHQLYSADSARPGIMRARAVGSPYVFSGLLQCAECGGSITVVSGCWAKRQDVRYGCSMNSSRGRHACKNNLLISRRDLEQQLLAGRQAKVLHPDVVEYTVQRCVEAIERQAKLHAGEAGQLLRRRAVLEREVQRLTDAIALGRNAQPLLDAIAARQSELAGISAKLANAQLSSVQLRVRDLRRFVEERMRELRSVMNADPVCIRAEIAKHVRKITLRRESGSYTATGTWDFLGFGSMDGAGGQNRTGYARLFRAALYQ
jgi:site-specific DNA recombinase